VKVREPLKGATGVPVRIPSGVKVKPDGKTEDVDQK
jgi:hypothetical protein